MADNTQVDEISYKCLLNKAIIFKNSPYSAEPSEEFSKKKTVPF